MECFCDDLQLQWDALNDAAVRRMRILSFKAFCCRRLHCATVMVICVLFTASAASGPVLDKSPLASIEMCLLLREASSTVTNPYLLQMALCIRFLVQSFSWFAVGFTVYGHFIHLKPDRFEKATSCPGEKTHFGPTHVKTSHVTSDSLYLSSSYWSLDTFVT